MTINLSALQKQRRDTAANWTAEDPTLLAGEIGLESDTGYWKVGDGATAWTSLAYVSGLGAEIPVDRLADGAARQLLQTDAAGTGVEWTDNVDVPGTLDVTGAGTFDGNVTIAGDLTVNGTTTTVNSETLLVKDKNIEMGVVATPTDVTADGGGITLKGTTDKTINWVDATDAWTLSEHVNIASGKEYRIDGTKVLDATSLGSGVTGSSLTSVGTIGTGVWQGTAIDAAYLDSTVVTTGDTGTVTSTMIADGTIVDGDINASAAIAGTKITPDFGAQNVTTTGTSTAASFIPTSSTVPTNGVYLPAANSVALSTNGTGRVFVDASGNVEIASSGARIRGDFTNATLANRVSFQTTTADSATVLQVLPNGTGTVSQVRLFNSSDADNSGGGRFFTTTGAFGLEGQVSGTGTDLPLTFSVGGSERLRITSDGKIGVGTSAPEARLSFGAHIPSDGQSFHVFKSGNSVSGLGIVSGQHRMFTASDASLVFGHVSTTDATTFSERVRIDSSGRLLVGTSTSLAGAFGDQALFQTVKTDGVAGYINWRFTNDSGGAIIYLNKSRSGSAGTNTIVQNGDTTGSIVFAGADGTTYHRCATIEGAIDGTPGANDMPGRLVFSTTADGASGPTEAMRINNGQELLVGYSADNGAYKLQVNSQIFATSATIATSDGRYKENVATLEGCVDLVKALRPVSFDWKLQKDITRIDDEGNEIVVREGHNFPDGTQVGFIAQEVQEVLADKPWLGSVIKQNVRSAVTDNDGNELAPEEEFLGIAEGNLIAVLTSALQEAISEIESLKARVAALESA